MSDHEFKHCHGNLAYTYRQAWKMLNTQIKTDQKMQELSYAVWECFKAYLSFLADKPLSCYEDVKAEAYNLWRHKIIEWELFEREYILYTPLWFCDHDMARKQIRSILSEINHDKRVRRLWLEGLLRQ